MPGGGGVYFWVLGEGRADFVFMGAGIFLNKGRYGSGDFWAQHSVLRSRCSVRRRDAYFW